MNTAEPPARVPNLRSCLWESPAKYSFRENSVSTESEGDAVLCPPKPLEKASDLNCALAAGDIANNSAKAMSIFKKSDLCIFKYFEEALHFFV